MIDNPSSQPQGCTHCWARCWTRRCAPSGKGPKPRWSIMANIGTAQKYCLIDVFNLSRKICSCMWCSLKVPNQLNIVASQLLREDRVRYKTAREKQILYEAATNLWMNGVDMTKAISIVHKAMKDSGEI